ncbi:MAG: hypothetical protein C0617_15370 [Desulfuromonas sp.]|uniref:M17 family peptidase N-terminal domain-containing protein n=1 Tax=Desulfuromonas sp. TaxID=892 RepID=UPI000CAAAAD4|nr:M17 family peptidase N-terminal domain-containing protein [Desulfuromonas sp.]PLX81906.1 MAG: hypothetical protein C0617_15370 [Desulfuromonas sp.]
MTAPDLVEIPIDRIQGEVVAVLYFEDERPPRGPAALLDWRLNGVLTELLVQGRAAGHVGEQILVPNNGKLGADWALFLGGGRWEGRGKKSYRTLVEQALDTCRGLNLSRVGIGLTPLEGMGEGSAEKMVSQALGRRTVTDLECQLCLG